MGGGSGTIATTLTGSKGKEQSRNDAPDWARGYEMDAATRANTEAQRGYENYGGQRQAGYNNDQQGAFQLYRNQVAGSPEMATGSVRLIGMLSQGGPANPYYGRPAYLANSQQLGADNLAYASSTQASNPYLLSQSPSAGNDYIGKTSAGISGAPSVLGYAQNKMDNPYIGQTTQGVTSVPQVGTGSNPLLGQNNPYLNSAIDQTAGDITRNYNLTTAPQFDSMARASGSFGNTGVDQMRLDSQRNLAREIGNASNNMRMQDYNLQANLGEQDLNRRMQANQFNAGNAIDAQKFNSQVQSNDIGRNLAAWMQQGQYNGNNLLDAAKFDASNSLGAQQFNANLGSGDLTRNSNLMQNMSQFNTGNRVQDLRQLQNLTNANSQFNAGNANNMSQYNAGVSNDAAKFNATNADTMSRFNAGENNAANRFNAGLFDSWNNGQTGLLNSALNYDTQRGKNAAGLLDIGNQQQQHEQTGLDQKYQDWIDQQNWNKNQLDWLAKYLTGITNGQGESRGSNSNFGWQQFFQAKGQGGTAGLGGGGGGGS